ncbi:peptide deformylase [Arthrobacter livingstonensis]|uniref:Peptide deformylase n=1 Tax=Arthrobacter livingstonensis TaxID=670078 RepID=A0A2V5LT38_9MICC|nr:peptide deformylase [Arthrobacter livingstonensis]PYI66307.1 peptide deformylase [Arthrobacter livingstonensis]
MSARFHGATGGRLLYTDAYVRKAVAAVLEADTLPAIVQAGHPVLRAQAVAFTGQLPAAQLARLIEVMRDTMHAAPGVGLAAPQIGIPLQLAVLEDLYDVPEENAEARDRRPLDFFAILNPHYTAVGAETASHYEGCLSMSGWQAVVDRAATIDLAYDDENGAAAMLRLAGWQARIVQHETDHLAGTMYLDKAHTRSLASNAEYAANWSLPDIAEARETLHF